MKDPKVLYGLMRLTQEVLKRTFSKTTLDKLKSGHMEVLSAIVFHHLFGLSGKEYIILMDRFGIGTGEAKTVEAIAEDFSTIPFCVQRSEKAAFLHLREAATPDLVKTMQDIESERAQS